MIGFGAFLPFLSKPAYFCLVGSSSGVLRFTEKEMMQASLVFFRSNQLVQDTKATIGDICSWEDYSIFNLTNEILDTGKSFECGKPFK